jgi:ATP-dependent 26S proteasome regulatory subunit
MTEPAEIELPPWAHEFRDKFSGGLAHTFVLHGAVEDYVGDQRTRLDHYLSELLGGKRVVVFYNCSRGISFAAPTHRTAFLEALNINKEEAPAMHEPFLPAPAQALPVLEQALLSPELKGRMALIIEYPELIWPNTDYGHLAERDRSSLAALRRWAVGSEFISAGQVILLVTQTASDLHSSLRATSSMIEEVEIGYPGVAERQAFIETRLADGNIQLAEGITPVSFASLTGGLSRVLVDDICLRAALHNQPVSLQLIRDRKEQIIRQEYGELIEILEPRHGFAQVGGMQEVKDYLKKSVIAPLRGEGPKERMPSGVMLAGPPGTGKTWLVSALAYEAGVNVVKLNAGRLLGQYVGNSERNLERALACIRSLAPTLVMIDEIEQQFQRGGKGDGGVERRIFGRILEEMSGASSAERGEVIWFAATNRIEMVDAALRRPGRFDRIVPILPPTAAERWEILHTKLPAGTSIDETQGAQILQLTENYTGADLDGVLVKAQEIVLDRGASTPTAEDILLALSLLRPGSDSEQVQLMVKEALTYCNDLSLVPAEWRQYIPA